ncbi:MAG: cation transporter [Ruminococcaceae bacterium]|nr:cation transporter [Oscillospiraceae bacterium]
MKAEKSIWIAFALNLIFSAFEFVGGIWSGSVAIVTDAVHDMGDAVTIGTAFFLEKKSRKQPDENYTYGYTRYSAVGGAITNLMLLFGSVMVVCNAVARIIHPSEINYNGMIVFAIVGVFVNLGVVFLTRRGESLNQKAVHLHMLEDVLGWIIVLVGAIVMRFTDFHIIDPLMSIGVAIFIFLSAIWNMKEVLDLFLEKTPHNMDISKLKTDVDKIEGVLGVHHIHVWSMDGHNHYATMHIVADRCSHDLKDQVRKELKKYGIGHATLELETEGEYCREEHCHVEVAFSSEHHHHHH